MDDNQNNSRSFLENVQESVSNLSSTVRNSINTYSEKAREKREYKELRKVAPMAKTAPGEFTGKFLSGFGAFLIILAVAGITYAFFSHANMVTYSILCLIPFIIGVILILMGRNYLKKVSIFETFKRAFGMKPYIKITTLAKHANMPVRKVVKYLEIFRDENLYPKGLFSKDHKYFLLSPEAETYLNKDLNLDHQKQEQLQEVNRLKTDYPELYQVREELQSSVKEINSVKMSVLKKTEIQDELSEMSEVMNAISDYILKRPEDVPSLSNFLDYFLPMLKDLLNTYERLENEPVQTENVKESKLEIEAALDFINDAFKNMYNDFYTGTAMNVFADVKVLESLINKNGYSNTDFH